MARQKDACARVKFDTFVSGRGDLRTGRVTYADGLWDAGKGTGDFDAEVDDIIAGKLTAEQAADEIVAQMRESEIPFEADTYVGPKKCKRQQYEDYMRGWRDGLRAAIERDVDRERARRTQDEDYDREYA